MSHIIHGSQLAIAKVFAIASVCESLLHGLYAGLFCCTIYLVASRRERNVLNLVILAVVIALYSLSVTHLALNIRRTVTLIPAPDISSPLDFKPVFPQLGIEAANCLLASAVIVWRTLIAWGHVRPIVIITLVLILVSVAANIGFIHSLTVAPPGAFFLDTGICIWSALSMFTTFGLNIWCTSLIGFRACQHYRRVNSIMGPTFVPSSCILHVVVESGVLYCLSWLSTFVMFKLGHHLVFVAFSIVAQLTGIYPTTVILLICLRTTPRKNDSTPHIEHQGTVSTVHFRTGWNATTTMSSFVSVPPMRFYAQGRTSDVEGSRRSSQKWMTTRESEREKHRERSYVTVTAPEGVYVRGKGPTGC